MWVFWVIKRYLSYVGSKPLLNILDFMYQINVSRALILALLCLVHTRPTHNYCVFGHSSEGWAPTMCCVLGAGGEADEGTS